MRWFQFWFRKLKEKALTDPPVHSCQAEHSHSSCSALLHLGPHCVSRTYPATGVAPASPGVWGARGQGRPHSPWACKDGSPSTGVPSQGTVAATGSTKHVPESSWNHTCRQLDRAPCDPQDICIHRWLELVLLDYTVAKQRSQINLITANSSSEFPFRSQQDYSCELSEQTALLSQLNEAKDCIKNWMSQKEEQTISSNRSDRQGLLCHRLISAESLHHWHESMDAVWGSQSWVVQFGDSRRQVQERTIGQPLGQRSVAEIFFAPASYTERARAFCNNKR